MKHIKIISTICMGYTISNLYARNVIDNPNVIIIYTDQQRFDTFHALGNNAIETPNFDRLIKDGVTFTHAFTAAPVSVSSRWSLHTGMYPTSHGAYSNHHQVCPPPSNSLPKILKDNGYKTVLVGKNHCFLGKTEMDIIEGISKFKEKPYDKRSAEKAVSWSIEEDPMHKLTNKAIYWLSQNKKNNKPTFMWLSYLYPHTPYMCPEPYFSMYDNVNIPSPIIEPEGLEKAGKPFRQQFHQINNNIRIPYDKDKTMRMKRTYYGMISMIDAEIGRLLDYLEQNDMKENTLIVFSSDHGDYMGDHGMYTKSPALYDCLTRVPLIFSFPPCIPSSRVNNSLVSSTDIMPTILDMLNLPVPEQVQGKSLKFELTGKGEKIERKYVFSEYGIPGKPILKDELDIHMPDWRTNALVFNSGMPWEGSPVGLAGRIRMIRSHDFKLVEEEQGNNELYDLRTDPNELSNVYNQEKYKDIISELTRELHKWEEGLPGIERDTIQMAEKNFAKYLNRRYKQ